MLSVYLSTISLRFTILSKPNLAKTTKSYQSNRKEESDRLKSDSNHRCPKCSQKNQSEKENSHSDRKIKRSNDPVKLGNSLESFDSAELDIDSSLTNKSNLR